MIRRLIFTLLFFFSYFSFSQSISGIKIPDSLKNKNYEYLEDSYNKYFKKDQFKAEYFANIILIRAKKEKNQEFIFDGYYKIATAKASNLENGYPFADSLIVLTKNVNTKEYPAKAYILKGILLNDEEKFDESLNYYVIAENLAKNKNENQTFYIKRLIAILKTASGEHKEALPLFKSYYEFEAGKFKKEGKNIQTYLSSIFSLSNAYAKVEDYKESKVYASLGISESKKYKNDDYLVYLKMINGINDFYLGNFEDAKATLSEIEQNLIQIKDFANLSILYYYLGKINVALKNENKAVNLFLKSDSISFKYQTFSPIKRDGYEFLMDYYKKINDKENLLKTTDKLLHFDSINNSRKDLSKNILKKYELPILMDEKNETISKLNNKSYALISFSVVVSLLIAVITYYWNRSRKQAIEFRKQAEILYESLNMKSVQEENSEPAKFNSEQSESILKDPKFVKLNSKITEFENSKSFLKKNVTLDSLSKDLETNRDYLSKLINETKGKNFSQYLNELRINYVVEELKANKELRKFTILAIADEIGYNNTESFTNAFKKITGTLPSIFIKVLNEGSSQH